MYLGLKYISEKCLVLKYISNMYLVLKYKKCTYCPDLILNERHYQRIKILLLLL